jgi:hypothetical protein
LNTVKVLSFKYDTNGTYTIWSSGITDVQCTGRFGTIGLWKGKADE